jgi:esterase/lipase superfamily enzyme
MEPIVTSIVTALAVGAAAGLKDDATQAVKNAYDRLKTLLTGKYPTTSTSLARVEEKPASDSLKAALAEILEDAGAQHDAELVQHAATLIAVIDKEDPDAARAIGVDLKDFEAANVTLRKVKATGTTATGVRLHSATAHGDITIEDVSDTAPKAPKKSLEAVPEGIAIGVSAVGVTGRDIIIAGGAGAEIWLAGLAARPYEEVVFYATDRESKSEAAIPRFTDSGVPAETLRYGECRISLPPKHRTGCVESPRYGQGPDPAKHVMLRGITSFADSIRCYERLTSRLANARWHDVMVFVHGVATSFEIAVKRTAQIRLDTQFPGVAMAYSWPSMGHFEWYAADYDRVDGAAIRLEQVVRELLQATSTETRVHLVGHSLGCFITARAIEALSIEDQGRIGEVILAAPDISRLDYPQLATALQQHARRVTVYTAPADRALKLSAGIRARIARVGSNVAYAVHPGIDAIDASAIVRRSWFGDRHGYVFEAPLISELRAVLDGAQQLRARMERRRNGALDYYVIRP